MRYAKPLSLAVTALLCASCAGQQALVIGPSAPCSSLVPESWAQGVESAAFPTAGELAAAKAEGDEAQPWRLFGVRQTGQLDIANTRTRDGLTIVRKCEARDQEAVATLRKRPWWRVLSL